jgi:hypothetical protein
MEDDKENFSNLSIEELFNKASVYDDPNLISESLKEALNDKIRENQPPDWQVRLNIMGMTPLTYAGFALAIVVIILNISLGTGWASRLLGLDDSIWDIESISDTAPPRLPVDNLFRYPN